MGPNALFDKSFLQSLNLDEAVWFDHFFIANICPLFYVETLADLGKSVRVGRTPEQEVRIIARKSPVMGGSPCANHVDMSINNLLGNRLPMTGQIPVAGGRPVMSEGKQGVVFDESSEAKAFSRWQQGKFLEVEREFARKWRENLTGLDLEAVARGFRTLGINHSTCKSLEQAKVIAHHLVSAQDKPFDRMQLAITFLNVPREAHSPILERWSTAGYQPLITYAPYAAHVLMVEVFFQIALAAQLIGTGRPSNRLDIAYLFYLPFCAVFTSSDLLHQKCTPHFLRDDQEFIWGPDLKSELRRLDNHFAALPDTTKEKGISAFAHYPPGDDSCLMVRLWDRHLPRWRQLLRKDEITASTKNEKLANHIKKIIDGAPPSADQFDPHAETESVVIQRFLSKRRGNWWQLPKDLEVNEDK